ncbi:MULTISPECIES: hypothetical protein [Streptomyces]|uniref:Uncharacterized protein n=1 Tax=Streptomyces tsukubensis (strain DSM 42081 / NBRC 108919 / NRRL 18488 / 9993) TaxID=1114943 RepID=I2N0N6_STRT9|nr:MULTISPECIES: hypothetical protein [Streptomyces]AZK94785.1 hypothetical protein B7R87_13610 [Streptomyces tsukubensis]EIF90583.1 hypothetical protein [Streptomyces tsukubensis NRRL18488]MYS68719.1 hypothetical protein [Streptomyces sp. SID5473]QKM69133.1 hypothetical protein STSU_020160 [Streptomyces tsukubensis NRRL18488]TAI42937.1 hypothetical protein EWI31_21375 [Streptomyces tsukubensis]
MAKDRDQQRIAAAEKIRAAEEAFDTLGEALARAGVRLPSLGVDPCAYAATDPIPLVELGRCMPDVALALAAVIDRGVEHRRACQG